MWDRFGAPAGHEIGRYASLAEMTRGAYAILQGTIATVGPGGGYGQDDPYSRDIMVTLDVSEVYKGEGVFALFDVVIGQTEQGNIDERYAALVGDEVVFFVAPAGAPRPEFGISGIPPDERSGAWIPVTSQGVAVNDGGTAVFAMNEVDEGFPASLEGIPFAELERRVHELAAEAA